MTAADPIDTVSALPIVIIAFVIGTCAYPLGSWVRTWIERIRPVKWKYRDVCGRECRIKLSRMPRCRY